MPAPNTDRHTIFFLLSLVSLWMQIHFKCIYLIMHLYVICMSEDLFHILFYYTQMQFIKQ